MERAECFLRALHFIFTFRFLQVILGNNIAFDTQRRSSLLILGRNSTLDRLKTYVCVIL